MSRSLASRLSGMCLAVLLVASAAQGAAADSFVGGTDAWTMVNAPSFITSLGNPAALATYSNHLGVNVSGIVMMVLRDNSSRLVYYATSTTTIAAGGLGTVLLVEFGLPPGTYHAEFFAFTFGGVAISQSDSSPFVVAH
jgi:hypothetical protein